MPSEAQILVLTPVSAFVSCEVLRKSLHLSEPRFFHLGKSDNYTQLSRWLYGYAVKRASFQQVASI